MEAMGFERSQIDRAMRAAFFNPDRAIEYLLSGIPESVQAEQRQGGGARSAAATSPPPTTTAAAAPTSPPAAEAGVDEPVNLFEAAAQAGQGQGGARGGAATRSGAGAAAGGTPGGAVNMDFLRNSPHFQHLRQLVQQQPAMLEPILQQVAEGNPQLAQMIGQNQDQFLQLLSEVCPSIMAG
jgi:UV excision repair protein RAD23